MSGDEAETEGEVDEMKRIIHGGESADGGEGSVERGNGSDGGFFDELSGVSEAMELVEGDQLGATGSTEPREEGYDEPDGSGEMPATPTKSDVLGFVRATDDIEEGNIYLPGEHWSDRPPARYVQLELVLEEGRLTRPGACMLCYASKIMSESPSPEAEVIARLNADGVDGFASKAFQIDPEEAKVEEGLDGLLS